jgi:hypothetical protein
LIQIMPIKSTVPRKISALLLELIALADYALAAPFISYLNLADQIERLHSDLVSAKMRANHLGINFAAADMLLQAIEHLAEADPSSEDGRWGLLVEQLAIYVRADMKRAGELELQQMRERV